MSQNFNFLKLSTLPLTAMLMLILVGCDLDHSDDEEPSGLPVTVVKAVQETVPITMDYVGQVSSIAEVNIRARVEGFLTELHFKEGDEVEKGQLLFVIDPRPFAAALAAAKGELLSNQANAEYYAIEEKRMASLVASQAISQEEYDQTLAQKKEADAQVETSKANVINAELNLGYTKMYAPVSGRIGQRFVDIGNLVGASSQTQLATIVQLEPIYALFSPSEGDYLKIIQYLEENPVSVTVTLASDRSKQFSGALNFVNNTVDQNTATILLRATINNKEEILLPGMYIHVDVNLGDNPDAILVPAQAVLEGQGDEYLYLVNSDNQVEQRIVVSSGNYQDKRVITEGLKADELVIVSGLTRIQAGTLVKPNLATPEEKPQASQAG